MTSTNAPKAGPPTSPESDLLTPEEIEALKERTRELYRRGRESLARLKAKKATKAAAAAKDASHKESGS